jgi:hypothetical protein
LQKKYGLNKYLREQGVYYNLRGQGTLRNYENIDVTSYSYEKIINPKWKRDFQ